MKYIFYNNWNEKVYETKYTFIAFIFHMLGYKMAIEMEENHEV